MIRDQNCVHLFGWVDVLELHEDYLLLPDP
jgi:hypothetical protein